MVCLDARFSEGAWEVRDRTCDESLAKPARIATTRCFLMGQSCVLEILDVFCVAILATWPWRDIPSSRRGGFAHGRANPLPRDSRLTCVAADRISGQILCIVLAWAVVPEIGHLWPSKYTHYMFSCQTVEFHLRCSDSWQHSLHDALVQPLLRLVFASCTAFSHPPPVS